MPCHSTFVIHCTGLQLRGGQWTPADWTDFMQSVRPNNDVEDWHHRLNKMVGGRVNLPMYQLITTLHEDANNVNLQIRLISERKLTKYQCTKSRESCRAACFDIGMPSTTRRRPQRAYFKLALHASVLHQVSE